MKPLKEWTEGESNTLPAVEGTPDSLDFTDPKDRESFNEILAEVTSGDSASPSVAYERVRLELCDVGYSIPPATEYVDVFSDIDGEVILELLYPNDLLEKNPQYLYFGFSQFDDGRHEMFAEILSEAALEDLFDESEKAEEI